MALDNFFTINFPYGLRKTKDNKWFAFNREYMPLGWNDIKHQNDLTTTIFSDEVFDAFPVKTEYMIPTVVLDILTSDEKLVRREADGDINTIFLYDSVTNPSKPSQNWDNYFKKIKLLAEFKSVNEKR